MRLYKYLNKINDELLLPFFLSSVVLLLIEILGIITGYTHGIAYEFLNYFIKMLNIVISYFFICSITMRASAEKRLCKTVWAAICYSVFFVIIFLKTGNAISLILTLLISFVAYYLYKYVRLYTASIMLLLFSVLLAFLINSVHDYFQSFIYYLAKVTENKGIFSTVLYSVINVILSMFDIHSFENMFMHTGFGGSAYLGDEIITGSEDLFLNGYTGEFLSRFVSGKYLLSAVLLGFGLSFLSSLNGNKKKVGFIIAVSAILSGHYTILLLFLFFICPNIIISALILSSVSYSVANILDLRCGILFNAGLIESFSYVNKPLYYFASFVILLCIGYFTAKYNEQKFGFTSRSDIYIPEKLKSFTNALGGIENIIKVNDDSIEVKNAKLVNELMLNFSAEGNVIFIKNTDKLIELKELLN